MNRPFVILLLPLAIGILISHFFELNLFIIFAIFCLIILGIFYNIIKKKPNQNMLIILFLILGIFLYIANDNSILKTQVNKRVECTGIVEEVLKKDENQEKYVIKVDELDKTKIKREKIILNIIGNKDLEIGDRISFNGELKIPMINTNPKLFNYRLNLITEKIFTIITIKEHSIISIDKSHQNLKYRIKNRFISSVENLFNIYLNEKNSSLIKSIILGKSIYLDEQDISLYRDMGLAHILAVSGLHIGVLSGFFIFIFSRIGIKRIKNVIFTLIILWVYGYLIGFPTSILRSNIMFSLLFYSQIIHEPYDSINTLSFAMFILLIINPYYLFNIGFQLSFAASFAIITFTPRIEDLFYPLKNSIVTTLSAILGVQIGLFPIQSYYFNKISLLGVLANIAIVPILSISLVLGFLMIFFNFTFAYVNNFIGPILNFIISIQFKILYLLNHIPFNIVKIFSPEFIVIIMFYIFIFILFKIIDIRKLKKPIVKTLVIYFIILLIYNSYWITRDDTMELHFIDVGQGDSILMRAGHKAYLMDTGGSLFGNFDIGEYITLAYLEKLGVRKLDAVFITHFDEDHSQGLDALLENMPIDMVLGSYIPRENHIYKKIVNKCIPFIVLNEGHIIDLGKNARLKIIWPNKGINRELSPNNLSLVSILSTNKYRVLFTGDIEEDAEYFVLDKLNNKVDIIKIPHHGSKTSSTERLLEKIVPKVGIISVGRNNIYGHPNKEVIDRYNALNTKLYRTDEMGLIKIILDDDNYTINTFLENGDKIKPKLYVFLYDNIFILSFYFIYFMLIYILVKNSSTEGDDIFVL